MSPAHHPSREILTAYAAGALEPGFALVVGAHIEGCAQCARDRNTLEAQSGAALAGLSRIELAPDALARTLAKLAAPTPAPAPPHPDARPLLQRLPLKPKRWVAPGVWVAAVDTPHAPDNRVYVLRVAPGCPTARHAHAGEEFCTVLKGAFRDEVGLFAAGDFAAATSNLKHQPVVEGEEECICLFATEGRLKPHGLVGRIAFALADV